MNLKDRLESVVAAGNPDPGRLHFVGVFFGQDHGRCLKWLETFMSLFFGRPTVHCSASHYKKSRISTDRQVLPARNRVML
jgi:hypothetical protein